ncbi:T9SS type A sorting domain-containing protein [Desertivirga xinjiangensis]|uniref:T9SS type A sorting domain-containing protein n=1 Tax=Desertivirga xinjiangensis TaxID=539206 RepID=UPI002108B529|nr:T9SS type A sorting domain-containing protein [Pedobacter xinjiangensis]
MTVFRNVLKVVCLCLFILVSASGFAQTTYYVSASGSDLAAGTSEAAAWKTLAKVNSFNFNAGDRILLEKGNIFIGKLRIISSGVTIDAYGSGNNPVLSGSEQVSSTWTVFSGSVWETTFSGNKPVAVTNLFNTDTRLPISRHPNKTVNNGYFNFESHAGLTQITDNDLSGSPDWTGSEIVIRSERWRLNRTKVSLHSGNSITIPSVTGIQNLRDGYGYFFVNDIKAIDTEGEWAYNSASGKLYLHSAIDPNTQSIRFPRTDTIIHIRSASNVTLKNVDVTCAGKIAVCLTNSPGSVIENVNISASGGDGIVYTGCIGGLFQNNSISDINNTGAFANTTNSQLVFKNNVVRNIGNEAYGKSKTFIGIDINSPNTEVSNNHVSKTGYTGILSAGLNNLVKRNVVDSACLILEDMAGIYTNYQNGANSGMIIEENFVFNSVGEMLGAPGEYSKANGIYVDNLSTGVTVRNNTVAFVNGAGLFANYNREGNQFYNNTSFSSGVNEFSIYKPYSSPEYLVKENILVSDSTVPHYVINLDNTEQFTFQELGNYVDNYVINPFQDTIVQVYVKESGVQQIQKYTPYDWEIAAPVINGTLPSPVRYDINTDPGEVIKFYYNTTASPKSITLPVGRYIDAKNEAYCGSTVLAPYTSLILFKKDDNGCSALPACATPSDVSVDSLTGKTARLTWNAVSDAINYDIRYRLEADSVWNYAHNLQDTTVKLGGLQPETYYSYEIRTSCYGNESEWHALPVFKTIQSVAEHVFINANYSNCSPATAFSTTHSDTDNKWTLQNSGGIGTVDRDYIRSSSATENAPEITLSVNDGLDSCSTYDIYFYYMSPSTQPWKTKARLSTESSFITFDRNTAGAELLADNTGTSTSNRLYRAKLGTVQGVSGFSVIIDDIYYGVSSSRSVFDGVGYLRLMDNKPIAPDSLVCTLLQPDKIGITWRDLATDETSYIVERKKGNSAFSPIATLPAQTQSYEDSITEAGKYTYRVYAAKGGCKSSYSNQLFADNTDMQVLGIQQEKQQVKLQIAKKMSMVVYPNPSDGVFTIEMPKSQSNRYGNIWDLTGKLLQVVNFKSEETKLNVDISSQTSGLYLLEVNDGSNRSYYKLVKK